MLPLPDRGIYTGARFGVVVWMSLLTIIPSAAQADYRDDIAKLYARWDDPESPGVAVGILDEGEFVYLRGFGMANLAEATPISGASMFNIASISKQFTAAAVAKLHLENALSLDDPIAKHLPSLPDWANTVTVQQLIHHQSGIPDIFSVMRLQGVEFDHVWGNGDVRPVIETMELEFLPGERFNYSNTNYVLLAEIVETVSGTSLRDYIHVHFLEPLGMMQTRIDDDLSFDQERLVISYSGTSSKGFQPVERRDVLVGDGNMVTTVRDFAKWDANLRDPKVGGEAWRDLLLQRGVLNDGQTTSYAFGMEVSESNGDTLIQHGGSWLRFRARWMHLREQNISVIEFGNHGSSPRAHKVLEAYLQDRK